MDQDFTQISHSMLQHLLFLFISSLFVVYPSCSFSPSPPELPSWGDNYQMEIALSALLGELTTRSINFIINKISQPTVEDVEDRLRRKLHRAQVIVDEAMGRRITNYAVLQQLDMLRDAMHKGHYMLDMFRCQSLNKWEPKDQVMSPSLSKLNSLKDFCSFSSNKHISKSSSSSNIHISLQLEKALDDLSSMIIDMKESFIFLSNYPVLYRQPYSMHLLLENCMFGRQREAEIIIEFLLHTQPHGAKELEILPIVGPTKVGKSTLIAHVCKDERVRDYFSEIWFLRDENFTSGELTTFTEGYAVKNQRCMLNCKKGRRLLIVVDLVGDVNEEARNKLQSASKWCMSSGSKIIVTSHFDKTTKLGTVQALTLNYFSYEAYWYFFKTLTFGSTDPNMHPELVYLAMEIAKAVKSNLYRASIFACMLRENFDIHFWYKVLAFLRGFNKKHVSIFGENPFNLMDQNKPSYFERVATNSGDLVIYHQYHQCFSDEDPKIRLIDVIFGNVRPHGKFEALVWRSSLPPYHSYVFCCEIGELKTIGAKRSVQGKTVSYSINLVIFRLPVTCISAYV